jgi:DNA-binding GntR family transcriptional regulator
MQIHPRTIREQVTDRIREQVVAGELTPGQALRETDFASVFGVSRGPVRDAFLQLAQEGILVYRANRGVTVSHPPKAENRELIVSLRQQIECSVVERGLERLDDAAMRRLEESLEELRAACDSGDSGAVARSDIAFHESLLTSCGGADFLPVWRQLCSMMLIAYSRLDNYDDVHREHAEILEAIRSGMKPAIIAALKANVR